MANIYDKHNAAFKQVSAWVIARDGEKIATIAIKFPRDGAGRLTAYVHFIGLPMVAGTAGGYGYDKRSAAIANAAGKMDPYGATDKYGNDWSKEHEMCEAFRAAIADDNGQCWYDRLSDAGFNVLQAV